MFLFFSLLLRFRWTGDSEIYMFGNFRSSLGWLFNPIGSSSIWTYYMAKLNQNIFFLFLFISFLREFLTLYTAHICDYVYIYILIEDLSCLRTKQNRSKHEFRISEFKLRIVLFLDFDKTKKQNKEQKTADDFLSISLCMYGQCFFIYDFILFSLFLFIRVFINKIVVAVCFSFFFLFIINIRIKKIQFD